MDPKKRKEIAESMGSTEADMDEKKQPDPSKVREKNPHNVTALSNELKEQKKKKQAMMDDLFPGEKPKK